MHHLRCRLVRGKASKGTNNAQLHSAIVLLVDSGRTTEQATWSLRCTSPILVTMSNSLPGSDRFTNQLPRLAHACSCCFCPALRQPLGGGGGWLCLFREGIFSCGVLSRARCRTRSVISVFPLATHFPKSSSASVLFCPCSHGHFSRQLPEVSSHPRHSTYFHFRSSHCRSKDPFGGWGHIPNPDLH